MSRTRNWSRIRNGCPWKLSVTADWQPACLEFDNNTAPVATASAAQVREPIYRSALARWRRFETQLAPLIGRLEKAGIAL